MKYFKSFLLFFFINFIFFLKGGIIINELSLITPEELKNTLKLQGVSDSDLEDESVLKSLIDLKVAEITALTGLPVNPVNRKQIKKDFHGDLFESDWYPIQEVTSFKIDGVELTEDVDYVLDETAGIFYLNSFHNGMLVIEYIHALSDEDIKTKLNPLISDMVLYGFTSLNQNAGEISSIHEADQSVSYDTSNSLGNRIYTRIEGLKASYNSPRVRWLV